MSRIQRSVERLAKTLDGKNKDYAGEAGEFSNFYQSSDIAGITPLEVIVAQIGIKVSRIQNLKKGGAEAEYESLKDSLLDLAGYAVIGHAYMTMGDDIDSEGCRIRPEPALKIWNPAG